MVIAVELFLYLLEWKCEERIKLCSKIISRYFYLQWQESIVVYQFAGLARTRYDF